MNHSHFCVVTLFVKECAKSQIFLFFKMKFHNKTNSATHGNMWAKESGIQDWLRAKSQILVAILCVNIAQQMEKMSHRKAHAEHLMYRKSNLPRHKFIVLLIFCTCALVIAYKSKKSLLHWIISTDQIFPLPATKITAMHNNHAHARPNVRWWPT